MKTPAPAIFSKRLEVSFFCRIYKIGLYENKYKNIVRTCFQSEFFIIIIIIISQFTCRSVKHWTSEGLTKYPTLLSYNCGFKTVFLQFIDL